jgi:glycosyltransferase involved in cell wall biosynthesis
VFSKYREELEDPWMLELAGNNYDIIQIKAFNQHITRKFGIGDLGLRMIPFLVPTILKYVKKEKVDFILYPVPPWYILTIAPLIKSLNNIPYGIDFIDPWVEGDLPKNAGWKRKISQKIAKIFEKKAVEKSSVIFSVSEGINRNLSLRYKIPHSELYAIPYGAEPDDYKLPVIRNKKSGEILIRYTGVVWDDAHPVLDGLFAALSEVSKIKKVRIEFTGTSYAGIGIAIPQLTRWIKLYNLAGAITEKPGRVSYKRAVELTLTADLLLLFGGMQPYYAASKLMGLVASGKPFIAFVHQDSFPAQFLNSIHYEYFVTYTGQEGNLPSDKGSQLFSKLIQLIDNLDKFTSLYLTHPLIQEHTAYGMTQKFVEPILKILNEQN